MSHFLGWHVAKLGDPCSDRQGIRHAFGAFEKDIARGLAVRCNSGCSQRERAGST
jgi:hypothetical protein